MNNNHPDKHPFETVVGSMKLSNPIVVITGLVSLIAIGWMLSRFGLVVGLMMVALPLLAGYLLVLKNKPIVGFYTTVILSFVLLGLGRYLPSLPVGLGMDGILVISFIALIFNQFYTKVDWRPLKKDVMLLACIWFLYSLFQAFNPEMGSFSAYFGGVRGISFYMFLAIPLTLLLVDNKRKLDVFLIIWGILSLLATLKGLQQFLLGPDRWEKDWLNAGGSVTHFIMGRLRIFSFMSDAGQFGANQAYTAVVAGIVGFHTKGIKKKIFFYLVAVCGIIGLFLSGTRGAMAIPLAGLFLYFVLRKNKTVLFLGIALLLVVFVFFKYTTIGQSNYEIRRMRTAFDLSDPSLQVRIQNQKILKTYLATRPFGGGIGHAGVKAQRFLPNAFLSKVATDSWYVLIWAEQGIVGLCLHLFILIYILIKSAYWILFRIRDPDLKNTMIALTSGYFGILVASYGNAVLGTLPTAILMYASMAILMNAKTLEQEQATTSNDLQTCKQF